MARIRSIKPDAWQDAQLGSCSREARLLWAILITYSDDEGRFSAFPGNIWGHGYTRDPDALSSIPGWLRELETAGLIVLYSDERDEYGAFPTWRDHQRISHATPSRIPAPPRISGAAPELLRSGSGEARVVDGSAVTEPLSVASGESPETLRRLSALKGEEGRGEEGRGTRDALPAPLSSLNVVPPPVAMGAHPDQAARLLAEAGIQLIDAYQLQVLHQTLPNVDLCEVARAAIRKHRSPSGLRSPWPYIHSIAHKPDAPQMTAAVAQSLPAFEQVQEAIVRAVRRHRHERRFCLRDLLDNMPAAAALVLATDWEGWWKKDLTSFEGGQFLRAARTTYQSLTVDTTAIQQAIDDANQTALTIATNNGQEARWVAA